MQAAIRVIAEAAASLDIVVVEIAEDGTEETVRSHPVALLLADQPNDWQSTFDLIHDLVARVRTHNIAADGQRDVPCIDIALSEAETFWTEFLRRLTRRDQSNVKQVIFDTHEGIEASVLKALAATLKRCGVYFMRDALLQAGKDGRTAAGSFPLLLPRHLPRPTSRRLRDSGPPLPIRSSLG